MALQGCQWAVSPRNGGDRGLPPGGFAVAQEQVYCFLSRREGDSEELVTTAAKPPKINTNSGSAFECS